MFGKTIGMGLGDWLGKQDVLAYNRTGATIKRGQVAMFDLSRTQAETTTFTVDGVETDVLANMTPVTQTLFENGYPCAVALEQITDNSLGRWRLYGRVEVATLDDDVSTTDIDKGDRVSMLVSESAVAVCEFVTGGTGTRCVGIALEDAAATSSDTDRLIDASTHLRWAFWMGGIPCLGATDT